MLVSNYVCNRRREDRDMFDSRLPFGFGRVSDLCFLRSGALLTSSCMLLLRSTAVLSLVLCHLALQSWD
jgi:hypothetical protein